MKRHAITVIISMLAMPSAASSPRPGAAAGGTSLAIDVEVPQTVGAALVDDLTSEADAIWRPMGVRLQWNRGTARERSCGCGLTLLIEEAAAQGHGDGSLGWIDFKDGVPGSDIHVSLESAEMLVQHMPESGHLTAAQHDALIGRALGRAFSHELGHYLLQSTAHSPQGLMRATWPFNEASSLPRDRFMFEPHQQVRIEQQLHRRTGPCEAD